MEEMNADKLVRVYRKIRDKRRELSAEFEKQDRELEDKLKMIEGELLEIFKATNTSSIKTEHGRVIRKINKRYTTNDWHSFHEFIKEHDALDLVERRISQLTMRQFLEENPDLHPPGLNVESQYTAIVYSK